MTLTVPPAFRYPEAVLYWLAYAWAFWPEVKLVNRSRNEAGRSQDKGTLRRILRTNQIALLFATCAAFLPWLRVPHPRLAVLLGAALIVAGGALRRLCFRSLGKYFTGAVVVAEGHQVIDTGVYRFVRHPSYTAGIIFFLGIAFGMGSWASIAFMTILPMWAYVYRVRAEEHALIETIGEPYVAYMKRTRRFIPFVI